MPAALLPNEGIGDQLEYILRYPISGVLPWTLIFFVNDLTPTCNTVLADLTEATWGGYTRTTLTRATWTTPIVDPCCATSTWGTDPLTWFVTGSVIETNYGYAYVDESLGVIRFIQRFDDADIAPVQPGGKVTLLPQYTLTSAECPDD